MSRPGAISVFDEIAARLADFSEVDSVLLMSGGYDLSLTMRGKSFQEIALFVAQRLSPLEGGAVHGHALCAAYL